MAAESVDIFRNIFREAVKYFWMVDGWATGASERDG